MADNNEVAIKDLGDMFTNALADIKKAENLLAEPSRKEAAVRFKKLSRRLFDIYRLFVDTFGGYLNAIAAKSMLLFARACLIVSHTIMVKKWFDVRENLTTAKRLTTLPSRALHKVVKRTLRQEFYLYNHDEEEYEKLGFGKLKDNSTEYEQILKSVAAGLKEMSVRLLYMFELTDLISPKALKKGPKRDVMSVKEMDFGVAAQDISVAKDIVFAYYQAITAQKAKEAESSDEEQLNLTANQVLSPLLEQFNMAPRKKVVANVTDKDKGGMFSEMTESITELEKVTDLLALLDEGEGV